ncbi:MAG: hypothetical protein JSS96_07540 [Bacteroidetes bacterium]|nr:hypothetical protein [Bacteroidota bacterium]
MTYEILPPEYSVLRKYKLGLTILLIAAIGMLFSFPFQGYAFFSIFFSTLFIFGTYFYSWIFLKDLFRSKPRKAIAILCVVALLSLSFSSVGPFTLAYMLASHSVNTLLYRDSIYTYLHLQYNGFFTLSVFALSFHYFGKILTTSAIKTVNRFAIILSISVVPTLFLSYLWHFTNLAIRSMAILGCVLLMFTAIQFVKMLLSMKPAFKTMNPFSRKIGLLSMIAFILKTIVQIGLIFPAIGNRVFGDRPMIIAYLHLVMLGFVSLFLLAYLIQVNYFESTKSVTRYGIIGFSIAVIANEIILLAQGLSAMLMISGSLYPLLLWFAAVGLFVSAAFVAGTSIGHFRVRHKQVVVYS